MNQFFKLIALFLLISNQVYSQESIYKSGWIDFNKNGKQDLYENQKLPIVQRVNDLISKMTIEEKVGQLLIPLGWPMYERKGDEVIVTELLKKEISERHIGSLWGFMRADPWTQRTLTTGLNPDLAAKATNQMQRYVIENSRLGIPLFLAEEAPHGHMAIGTTVFPTSVGLSSTWDPLLIGQMAQAVAQEVRRQGGHIAYGPILDLLRDPRFSRTEETFGEDPYLTSKFGIAYVKGLQGDRLNSRENVISTLKHFAAYAMPQGGHNGGSAHIGEFDLNEYIYPPFKSAVKAGARSVMASYNEIDGFPCHSNRGLLTDLLKNSWGFKGFVVSDLGGIDGLIGHGIAANKKEAALKSILAGVDVDLGSNNYYQNLADYVKSKKLDESIVNESVKKLLTAKFEMGLFDQPFVDEKVVLKPEVLQEHRALARKVADESIILLKNEKSLLPLKKDLKSIAVIGPNADNVYNMLGDYTAPQMDGHVVTVIQGIKNLVSKETVVKYAKGCAIRSESEEGFEEALKIAKESEVVILVMGGSSARDFSSKFEATGAAKVSEDIKTDMECGEGYDRATLNLMGKQEKLMQEIAKLGKPVVLVLIKGRPLILNWADKNIPAILDAWYPGMEGGNAIADVLFGDYNPAGRLTISVPRSVGQLPVFYNPKRSSNRSKYIDESGDPLYPFGYGLSYTEFVYSNLQISQMGKAGTFKVTVSLSVSNTGKYDGDEVVQLYLRQKVTSHTTPSKKLVAFKRVNLKAGAEKNLTFDLDNTVFELYQGNGKWAIEPGDFKLMIGGASNQISLEKDFVIGN
jgi:beta-glucosidase